MKKSLLMLTPIAMLLASSFTHADEIKLGTGSEKGNYFSMAKDIASYCQPELGDSKITYLSSDGSIANLLGIQNKLYSAGIIQEDVLQYYAKRSPQTVNKNRLKVISPLHVEQIHLLIPKDYKPEGDSSEKKSWLSYFTSGDKAGAENKAKKLDLDLLKGQKIGSWGGSLVSAEALSFFFDLKFNVVEIPDAQRKGKIDMPLLLVGGAPYPIVDELLKTGNYTLVALDYDRISQQAGFYSKETLNYNIDGKIRSIPTIGVRALLMGQSFRKAERNKDMSLLSNCVYNSLEDLADDSKTNPLWGSVTEFVKNNNGQVDWSYFPMKNSKDKKGSTETDEDAQ